MTCIQSGPGYVALTDEPICTMIPRLSLAPENVSLQGSSQTLISTSVKEIVTQIKTCAEATTFNVTTTQTEHHLKHQKKPP
ncbi:rifin, putative [Plasmodium sp. DRC-Itaito]|nr:rifin, putative [Plasmodium sp. DRC-Itaito]